MKTMKPNKKTPLEFREVLAEHLTHAEWATKAKTFPVGAVWSAKTGKVYAPDRIYSD